MVDKQADRAANRASSLVLARLKKRKSRADKGYHASKSTINWKIQCPILSKNCFTVFLPRWSILPPFLPFYRLHFLGAEMYCIIQYGGLIYKSTCSAQTSKSQSSVWRLIMAKEQPLFLFPNWRTTWAQCVPNALVWAGSMVNDRPWSVSLYVVPVHLRKNRLLSCEKNILTSDLMICLLIEILYGLM